MAQSNSHEVLLTYSADAVYLYSTRDEPQEGQVRPPSVLKPNDTDKKSKPSPGIAESEAKRSPENIPLSDSDSASILQSMTDVLNRSDVELLDQDEMDESDTEEGEDGDTNGDEDEDEDEAFSLPELDERFKAPVIMPRRRYTGHCNVETVKDVNFIGPEDEYVASGSDDGNFFLWEKETGRLHGIYEGDQAVVNVIEGHPRLPLIACSGIDTTVKLFAPTEKPATYSRIQNAEGILRRNAAQTRTSVRAQTSGFARLLWLYTLNLGRSPESE